MDPPKPKNTKPKTQKYPNPTSGMSTHNLFDNPMTRKALASLTPEQREYYRKLGEEMYGSIDFTDSTVLGDKNIPPFLSDALQYIKEGIKSGLHISELSDDEKKVLEECYGPEWYTQFGYTKDDLNNPL